MYLRGGEGVKFLRKKKAKQFAPCLDTLLWLWGNGVAQEDIGEVIENEFSDYCELCPVCKSEWVYEGQWNRYVEDKHIHNVYQNLANGAKSIDSAVSGYTEKCCSTCHNEDGLGDNIDNTEGSYIRHLCWEYQTWKEYGCEGDKDTCDYCLDESMEVTA